MEKRDSLGIPVVTLSNNVRVANFSASHEIKFVDGSILPACTFMRDREMTLIYHEKNIGKFVGEHQTVAINDVEIVWDISPSMGTELTRLLAIPGFDVLIVPSPILQAMKSKKMQIGRARSVVLINKLSDLACIDKFCI